jgi:hypothetical protein
MSHLDFTIDFETCAMTDNAAPMQVAIVPWRRDAKENPFVLDDTGQATEEESSRWPEPFFKYVDLRSCVVDGFDFDPETVKWWSEQSEAAKEAVCMGLAEPVQDVLISILDYIRDVVAQYQLDSICLWSQGADFDIAILRNLCRKYDVNLEVDVPHTSFRDCRTLILEAASAKYEGKILEHPGEAYKCFNPLPDEYADGSEAHNAIYDALRSSLYTWQALKSLKQ